MNDDIRDFRATDDEAPGGGQRGGATRRRAGGGSRRRQRTGGGGALKAVIGVVVVIAIIGARAWASIPHWSEFDRYQFEMPVNEFTYYSFSSTAGDGRIRATITPSSQAPYHAYLMDAANFQTLVALYTTDGAMTQPTFLYDSGEVSGPLTSPDLAISRAGEYYWVLDHHNEEAISGEVVLATYE